MSKSKHTPGPWDYSFESIDPEWAVVKINGGLVVANVNSHARQEANARLIAAAPEMYEALVALKRDLETRYGVLDLSLSVIEAMERALAKAEGVS